MPPRFIAKQLSHPTGLIGSVIAKLMNRHNARMNAYAVRHLELTHADRILEIGFGGGVVLPTLIESAGFVCGLDRSEDVVRRAKSKFAAAIRQGRVEFRHGSVEALPFDAGSFGKVYTAHTVYFWTSLDQGFSEIYRVLSPEGRLIVSFLPKERMDLMKMPTDIFTTRAPEDVLAALSRTGFRDLRVTRPEPTTAWNAIVATRP